MAADTVEAAGMVTAADAVAAGTVAAVGTLGTVVAAAATTTVGTEGRRLAWRQRSRGHLGWCVLHHVHERARGWRGGMRVRWSNEG